MIGAPAMWIVLVLVACLLQPTQLLAQEDPEFLLKQEETKETKPKLCPCDGDKEEKEEKFPYWDFVIKFGSQLSLSQSSGVVGVQNGGTRAIGGNIHFEANWARNRHEVRNRVDINALFIKTPNTSWLSAADQLDIESVYQFRAKPWFGPFVRAGFTTSMFVGRDLRPNDVDYRLNNEAVIPPKRLDQTQLRLTDPFKPITLVQTVGIFFNPIREEAYNLDIRTGIGGREVFTDGQFGLLDDTATTDIVEVVSLQDYQQAGWELIVMLRGELFEKKLSYYAGAELLFPFVRSKRRDVFNQGAADTTRNIELIDKTFRAGLAYSIASWATLIYEFRVVHQPQLIDRYQIQNSVGFEASYSVYGD